MKRFAYLHWCPNFNSEPWRVYPAVVLEEGKGVCPFSGPYVKGQLLVFDPFGHMAVVTERHLKHRNSAAGWVYQEEFDLLRKDIEDDWIRRQCWREAYEDVRRIAAELAKLAATPGKDGPR